MHVSVFTCAHRGDDARIVHRQARSLLEAGHQVTLVAPLPDDMTTDPTGLVRIPIPRAVGRRRVGAWRAVGRVGRQLFSTSDIVVLHDPELVPLLARRRAPVPVVWDVHEDFVASVADRSYVPGVLEGPVRAAVRLVQRWARRRCHLVLAEESYTDHLGPAPVVPNSTWVLPSPLPYGPAPRPRVVYLGRISTGRGAGEMLELADRLRGLVDVELIGPVDREIEDDLRAADATGRVTWHGPLPNPVALDLLAGAACGLALLHDEPNYRHSRPTKLMEYLARGVPVVSTPLPVAASFVSQSGGGEIVPFGDVVATVAAVERLCDPAYREVLAAAGHSYVREHHDWGTDGARFVGMLESWARRS